MDQRREPEGRYRAGEVGGRPADLPQADRRGEDRRLLRCADLAIDSGGTLHVVFAECPGGPFERCDILYTRSGDGGATFAAPRAISQPLPERMRSATYPSLSLDGDDNLYVLWELQVDHRQRPRGLGIAVSENGGTSFTAPAPVPDSADRRGGANGSHQGLLMRKLAVSRSGQIAVVNSSLEENKQSRVWLMRAERR